MISARARGVVLYTLAVAFLLAGAFWYVRTAPSDGTDPRVRTWQRSAGNLLPDLPLQVVADTIVMAGGSTTQRSHAVDGGAYSLSMVCLGERGAVRIRLSSSGYDSGRAVPCAEAPQSVSLTVGLADEFSMQVDAETEGSVAVFRWRLDHAPGF